MALAMMVSTLQADHATLVLVRRTFNPDASNTLSNCVGAVPGRVQGRSPAFMDGRSSGRLPPPVLSERS